MVHPTNWLIGRKITPLNLKLAGSFATFLFFFFVLRVFSCVRVVVVELLFFFLDDYFLQHFMKILIG